MTCFILEPPSLSLDVLLQRFAYRPTARQQFTSRFSETASERPKPLERDLDLGSGIDEVVMVIAGTVGDGAEAYCRARLDGRPFPAISLFALQPVRAFDERMSSGYDRDHTKRCSDGNASSPAWDNNI
jgi:hypothetical protein